MALMKANARRIEKPSEYQTELKRTSLIPFENNSNSSLITLDVEAERSGTVVSLRYLLNGNLETVQFPSREKNPGRADQLWETTCFEAFLGLENESRYWELNLSPSGAWNIYSFDDYRKGSKPDDQIHIIQKDFRLLTTESEMKVVLDLSKFLSSNAHSELMVGLTAVVEAKNSEKSYWAIQHLGAKPDFHLRQSFLMVL
jgi:hypothetical protein